MEVVEGEVMVVEGIREGVEGVVEKGDVPLCSVFCFCYLLVYVVFFCIFLFLRLQIGSALTYLKTFFLVLSLHFFS